MKKFLILASALFAAAVFTTSCVETVESTTVTELRNAKAAEMSAYADMIKAQAKADSVEQAAYNDYLKAQAEYQKAWAEYEKALADKTNANTDLARQQMEQSKQKFELELERLRKQYELDMLNLQIEMDRLYNESIDNANERINTLYRNYTTEFNRLIGLKDDLNEANLDYLKADNDILDAQEYVAKETARLDALIAKSNAAIAVYESYSGVDVEEINDRLAEIAPAITVKRSEMQSRLYEMNEANNAVAKWFDSKYWIGDYVTENTHPAVKIIDSLINHYQELGLTVYLNGRGIGSERILIKGEEVVPELVYSGRGMYFTVLTYSEETIESVYADLKSNIQNYIDNANYYIQDYQYQIDNMIQNNPNYENVWNDYQNQRADKENLYNEAKNAFNNLGLSEQEITEEYKEAQQNLWNAQEAYDQAVREGKDLTQYKQNLQDAQVRYDNALANYDIYQEYLSAEVSWNQFISAYENARNVYNEIESLKQNLNSWITELNNYQTVDYDKELAKVRVILGRLAEVYDDYLAEVEGWASSDLVVAYFQSVLQYLDSEAALDELVTEQAALNDMLSGISDIKSLIEKEQNNIEDYNKEKESLTNVQHAEDAKAALEEKIANLEEQVAIQEKIVEAAKAALDEALAGNDETPAE